MEKEKRERGGIAKIDGELGQIHADIVETIFYYVDKSKKFDDGRVVICTDPLLGRYEVTRTNWVPKALTVALSFYRLLGLGYRKQDFAKIATLRGYGIIMFHFLAL